MNYTNAIAKHLRELYFGGNWTAVNFKSEIENIDLSLALKEVNKLNTIAKLLFHTNYYVEAIIRVLNNQPINAKDSLSFDHPNFETEAQWQTFKELIFENVETLLNLIESLDDVTLSKTFVDKKYKSYYRNLHGLIEHSHYHLGQIVIIKKILTN